MAWTTPASYSVSEVLAASKLNTHVRDNLRFLKGLDGNITLESPVRVESTFPQVFWKDTDGSADAKVWSAYADSNLWKLRTMNDAEGTSVDVMTATRSGTAISGIAFAAPISATILTVGNTNFSSVGTIRMANATGIGWRNAANSADITMTVDSSNRLQTDALTILGNGASLALQGTGNMFIVANGTMTFQPASGVNFFELVNASDGFRPSSDNTVSCGRSGNRWSVIWAGTGAINTSSREVKEIVGVMDDDLALAQLMGLPAVYRFHYKHPKEVRPGYWADGVDGRPLELEADRSMEFVGPVAEELPDDMRVGPTEMGNVNTEGHLMAAVRALGKRLAALEADRA
jgi:hypothetical protein